MKKENTAKQMTENTGENKDRKRFQILHWRKEAFFLVLYDLVTVNLAYAFALFVRFESMYNSCKMRLTRELSVKSV